MTEKTPGRIGRFIRSDTFNNVTEALRTGGMSLLVDKSKERSRPWRPWNENTLQAEFSKEDDAAYIRVNYGEVARTETVKDGLHIDYDSEGDIVGIEMVGFNLKHAKDKYVAPKPTK